MAIGMTLGRSPIGSCWSPYISKRHVCWMYVKFRVRYVQKPLKLASSHDSTFTMQVLKWTLYELIQPPISSESSTYQTGMNWCYTSVVKTWIWICSLLPLCFVYQSANSLLHSCLPDLLASHKVSSDSKICSLAGYLVFRKTTPHVNAKNDDGSVWALRGGNVFI